MKIINTSQKAVIAQEAVYADTFWTRMVGLVNRQSLGPQEALVITRCQSIHMFFMRFPIDVIFVGKDKRVVGLVKGINPFRLSPIFFQSRYAIELAVGAIEKTQTAIGDHVEMIS